MRKSVVRVVGAMYIYNPETGYATVKVDVIKEPLSVEITFSFTMFRNAVFLPQALLLALGPLFEIIQMFEEIRRL